MMQKFLDAVAAQRAWYKKAATPDQITVIIAVEVLHLQTQHRENPTFGSLGGVSRWSGAFSLSLLKSQCHGKENVKNRLELTSHARRHSSR